MGGRRPEEAGEGLRWSLGIRLLHWVLAALMIGLLGLGFVMMRGRFDLGTTFALYQAHKSYGLVVLPLVAWRLALRLGAARPAGVGALPQLERVLSQSVQALCYGLMVALPLTGWLLASASPLALPTRPFGLFTMPDLVRPDAALFERLAWLHAALAAITVALVALHVAGALKHMLVDRDGVVARIGFGRRRG